MLEGNLWKLNLEEDHIYLNNVIYVEVFSKGSH